MSSLEEALRIILGKVTPLGVERVDLKPDGPFDVLGRDAGERHLPHDHFAARQQHRGAQMAEADGAQEAPVLGAPFRRRAPGIARALSACDGRSPSRQRPRL